MIARDAPLRVLVTGSRGYIGTVLAPALAAEGFDVTGLDSCLFEECSYGPQPPQPPLFRADIRDIEPRTLEGFDAIVHLAALCNDPLGSLHPEITADINWRATVRLAELAREAGVSRFVFASSCSLYGAGGDDAVTEDTPLSPLTPYAESKARSEEGLSRLATRDFSPVYMRNATVFGASPRVRADLVLNNLVGWAITTRRVRLLSDGKAWRPLLHVRDLAAACIALLRAPREVIHNRAFNIGRSDSNILVSDLAAQVRQLVPGTEIELAGGAVVDPRNYRVDFTRVSREIPAYEPAWDIRSGILEMASFYRNEGLTHEIFTGPRLNRLSKLQDLMRRGRLDAAFRLLAAQ